MLSQNTTGVVSTWSQSQGTAWQGDPELRIYLQKEMKALAQTMTEAASEGATPCVLIVAFTRLSNGLPDPLVLCAPDGHCKSRALSIVPPCLHGQHSLVMDGLASPVAFAYCHFVHDCPRARSH